jgi:hypothetical protein
MLRLHQRQQVTVVALKRPEGSVLGCGKAVSAFRMTVWMLGAAISLLSSFAFASSACRMTPQPLSAKPH